MKLIVGLGNYPTEYKNTRHNIGFDFIDYYVKEKLGGSFRKGFKGEYYEAFFKEKAIFLKPFTYMNLSGESVGEISRFFKIAPEDILVFYDDLDLEFPNIKISFKKGSGGHNGIQSVINAVGKEFYRVRVGIKNDEYGIIPKKNFVLSKFSEEELKFIKNNLYDKMITIAEKFVAGKIVNIMNEVNKRK
jgi:PTH1 family peptidyl-tRNA hydrolase